jgi:intracellular multiplication protein IcmV
MGLWSGFKKTVDFVFYIRPKKWFSWDLFKTSSLETYKIVKEAYHIPKTQRVESFNQAVARYQLTEEQVAVIKNRFYLFSVFFLICSLGIFIYAIEGLLNQHIMQGITSLCLVIFLGAKAFRYHFWYFQICQKKLGCTLTDWVNFVKS